MTMAETSTKPYFVRALHGWCTDNGFTPHVVVQVDENTRVPMSFVRDGQITLNVTYSATHKLELGNEFISFEARFGGKTEMIWVPMGAVTAIYAKETGTGMGFEAQASTVAEPTDVEEPARDEPEASSKRPHLKIVK